MKKLLISLAFSVGLIASVHAQNFGFQRLINAQAIYLSNSVTFVTNLAYSVNSSATNCVGVIWTNNFGQTESSTNITPAYTNSPSIATNIGATYNLLKDATLVVDRNVTFFTGQTTNACIYIHTQPAASGSANATNALSLVFEALPDGVSEDTTTTPLTFTTANAAAVTTATGSGIRFPFPASAFQGCQKIRLIKIYTVAPTAAASDFWIDKIEYCAFVP